ncbi:hypothetical protein SLE2022_082460 [Rubroshorea leprosula]
MAQSFDTVGWFARDPSILSRVGHVLLHLPMVNPTEPIQVIISEDCFSLSSIPSNRTTEVLIKSVKKLFGDHIVKHVNLGDYVKDRVPSLQKFMNVGDVDPLYNIASLAVLSSAMRLLQRYEFKKNHAEWITRVNPDLGPGIFERVWEAVRTTGENIDTCHSVKIEFYATLSESFENRPGGFWHPCPSHNFRGSSQTTNRSNNTGSFSSTCFQLVVSCRSTGFCQVRIPLGMDNNLPVSISLLARRGSDSLLLNLVETLYDTLKQESEIAEK